MDFITNLLAISQPTGMWASIINAFENGVGSYLLAIVLITLVLRLILAPLDTINKRVTKKQTEAQAKLQPEMEKIQKKYGHDKALMQRKQQELYKKAGLGMGGSCLIMLLFMAINLTVFFTLFSSLNGIADYKINQQYLSLKDNYSNSLNLMDSYIKNNPTYHTTLRDYENLTIRQENDKVSLYQGETLLYEIDSKSDFTEYSEVTYTFPSDISTLVVNYNAESEYTELKVNNGTEEAPDYVTFYVKTSQVVKNENVYTLETGAKAYSLKTSDQYIFDLVRTYISKETVAEGVTPVYTYVGDELVIDNEGEENDVKLSGVIKSLAIPGVVTTYEETQKENSFLWIGSIWVADSPFKSSVFTFDEYKKEIGEKNVSAQEEVIYNSFMDDLRAEKGRVNGYFILAIISVGVSFLSMWLGQLGTGKKKKKEKYVNPLAPNQEKQDPSRKSGKVMMFIMPIIMGIFAALYNSVFAIYLVVGQAISAALVPLNNLIIKAWDKHDAKKKQAETPVVDYRRK